MTVEEWLNNNELSLKIWYNKYQYNNETFDQWLMRVSQHNAEIAKLIQEKKFIFGGRTLANRGTNKKGSFSNCYSIGYVPDSLQEILDVNTKIGMTFKSQGGQGLSLSKIRPKGTSINNQFKSDGIIPFMEIFNRTTESISQGGSRKGALLMSLDICHKEAKDFIKVKEDLNRINKANLSLEIDDKFMEYVVSKQIDVEVKRIYEKQEIAYHINPTELFDLLCESAWKSAEPGIIFTNRFRNYNIMEHVDEYQIETCNPCGEQPLPKHGACNLSSINVSEYIIEPFTNHACINYDELALDLNYIVQAMDDVLEENIPNHALQEQKEMAKNYRNIGIGIMGLHDAFIKLGVVYGSPKSITIASDLMKHIFRSAVYASVKLAQVRGSFPKYSSKVWDSTIIHNSFTQQEIQQLKELNCLRNCSLLSIAPTGSIGTMLNISTGVEPWFMIHHTRTTKALNGGKDETFDVYAPVAQEALNHNWHPETLINSLDINYRDRIAIQSVLQDYCDTAISSTINLPSNITKEEIKELYIYAWQKQLKGITIFREGSREPILASTDNKTLTNIPLQRGEIIKAGDTCIGLKRSLTTGCGTLHCTAFFDPETGDLRETYLNKGSQGGCNNFMIGLSRLISLSVRGGIPLDKVIDQLQSCGACPSYASRKAVKNDTSPGSCCPIAVGKALKEMHLEVLKRLSTCKQLPIVQQEKVLNESLEYTECPECHQKTLIHEGGCVQCSSCGYSHCG